MGQLVHLVNWPVTQVVDALIWPFRHADPMWALVLLAAITGVFMLWFFGKVSRQEAIHQVRERIRGNLLGIRLYQHDVRVVLGLQGRILWDTLIYLKYALIPMLILLIPVMLLLAQVNRRFSLRPLAPGETTLVKVHLSEDVLPNHDVTLRVPEGIQIETPPVHIVSEQEVVWRIRTEEAGIYKLDIRVDDSEVHKLLWVGDGWGDVSPLRTRHAGQALLYSNERLIRSDVAIADIEVLYPPLSLSLLSWKISGVVLFLAVSLLVGFSFKRLLGVEI